MYCRGKWPHHGEWMLSEGYFTLLHVTCTMHSISIQLPGRAHNIAQQRWTMSASQMMKRKMVCGCWMLCLCQRTETDPVGCDAPINGNEDLCCNTNILHYILTNEFCHFDFVFFFLFFLCVYNSRYALDIIGSVAFGMDVNTLENPDNAFRKMEKRVNNGELFNVLRQTLIFLYPR